MKIAGIYRLFFLVLGAAKSGSDAVGNTGRVGDNQGGTGEGGSLLKRPDGLVVVCTHSNLSHIYVSVGHCHRRQVFFSGSLAAGDKLSGGAKGGCL